MKYLLFLSAALIALVAVSPAIGQTPEDEKIAKSLYLKASKAVRDENYQDAVKLLTQILDEYPESEVALDADQLLTDISDKAQLAELPKTPGFYWVEQDGNIVEMVTRPLKKGAPYELKTVYATFSQEQLPEIFADELSKFIVYRPKGDLQDVFWTSFLPLLNVDAEGNQVLSGNWHMSKEWQVNSVEGDPFGSSQVVFEEIKAGMWEVGFPSVFSPSEPVVCGLIDGTGQVGLVIVQSKMVHSFYPFLEFWRKAEIDLALGTYIARQLKKHPDNPDLMFFDAVLKYKLAYKESRPQTEVAGIARRAEELAQDASITPKVFTDLGVLLEYCTADSIVRTNAIGPDDSPEVRSQKHMALNSYSSDKIPVDLFWIQAQIARNHAFMGEFDEAILVAEKAVETFKKKKPNTGSSFLGISVKVEVSAGKPGKPEAFRIDDALSCFTLEPEWDLIKNLKKEMESEKFLGQALRLKDAGGASEEIEKALKESKDKNENNIRCYDAMIQFYDGIGKPKDASNAQKNIEKAKERMSKMAAERAST